MDFAELVLTALKLSVAALVFTIGLGTTPRELTFLVRNRGLLLRAFVAIDLVMPAVAVAMVKLTSLHKPAAIALVALSLSPVPPLLPRRLLKAGGAHAFVMALLCTAALFSVVWIPLAAAVLDALFPADIVVPPGPVAAVVLATVILPVAAGMLTRRLAPRLAERIAGPIATAAFALLALTGLLLFMKLGPAAIGQLGGGTLAAIVVFILIGLAVGHLLGGPKPEDRTVLAIAASARHPGMAYAIAHLVFPHEKAVLAVEALYLIASLALTALYVALRRRAPAPPTA